MGFLKLRLDDLCAKKHPNHSLRNPLRHEHPRFQEDKLKTQVISFYASNLKVACQFFA